MSGTFQNGFSGFGVGAAEAMTWDGLTGKPTSFPVAALEGGLQGGDETFLDNVVTDGLAGAVPMQLVLTSTGLEAWTLAAGTDATDVSAGKLRPLDYGASNQYVWTRRA
jgi:hypothetical protein